MKNPLTEAATGVVSLAPDLEQIAARIGIGALSGFAVAGVYALTLGRHRPDQRSLPTTLVLLSILVAAITIVIGDSVSRAFGLVGALSIVRFRSVVENTSDTAFVIFSVALGMAAGAGPEYWVLALVALPVVGISAYVMTWLDSSANGFKPGILSVKIAVGLAPEILHPTFAQFLKSYRLNTVNTAKQGAVIELTYLAKPKEFGQIHTFIAAMNKLDGVSSVEWKSD